MHSLKAKLQQEIEQLGEAELRALQRFIADLTLPEAKPLPEEIAILDDVEASAPDHVDYVPWQRRTGSS
ncbi:MAG: hypothetical protein KGZ35_07525 [Truepera sp.]|nr:hypothetical protein [Truepera sp.]